MYHLGELMKISCQSVGKGFHYLDPAERNPTQAFFTDSLRLETSVNIGIK